MLETIIGEAIDEFQEHDKWGWIENMDRLPKHLAAALQPYIDKKVTEAVEKKEEQILNSLIKAEREMGE